MPCELYLPGHRVHWIQAKRARAEPHEGHVYGIVTSVHADGRLTFETPEETTELWNHDPASLEFEIADQAGRATYIPRWKFLQPGWRQPEKGVSYKPFSVIRADDPHRRACGTVPKGATLRERLLVAGGFGASAAEAEGQLAGLTSSAHRS